MVTSNTALGALALAAALLLGGCANSGDGLTTASLTNNAIASNNAKAANNATASPVAKVNFACATLAAKIDDLRREGTMARLAKVAQGKSRATMVKRAALAKASALDQANMEYQAKCSAIKPASTASMLKASGIAATAAASNQRPVNRPKTAASKTVAAAAAKTAVKSVKK